MIKAIYTAHNEKTFTEISRIQVTTFTTTVCVQLQQKYSSTKAPVVLVVVLLLSGLGVWKKRVDAIATWRYVFVAVKERRPQSPVIGKNKTIDMMPKI